MASSLARVKRALTRLSAAQLIDRARAHVVALSGNPWFPSPQPSLAVIEAAIDALVEADAAVLTNGGRQDYLARNQRMRELKDLLILLAAYVQVQSGGDAERILSTGFGVRAKAGPAGPLLAPANLRARFMPLAGMIHLHWGGVRRRLLYEVQIRAGHGALPEDWTPLIAIAYNYFNATGLASSVDYSFRVRAIGAAGPGPWSDIAVERPM